MTEKPETKPSDDGENRRSFWRAYGRAAGVLGVGWAMAAGAIFYAVAIHEKDAPPSAKPPAVQQQETPRP